MFKTPTKQELSEMLIEVPEIVDTLVYGNGGYLKKVRAITTVMRYAAKLGVGNIITPLRFGDAKWVVDMIETNGIPDCAFVENEGKYGISFHKDPILGIAEEFGELCDGGTVYLIANRNETYEEINMLQAAGVTLLRVPARQKYLFLEV